MKRIYLSSPHMGGGELDFIHDAFEKNWIAPLGENVNKFEEVLQGYTGRTAAAVLTSGTAAIHLGLILCGVEPGDEVICQSFTFAATANPIRYQGATPVFVDSEPDTWNMDPDLLEEVIVDRMEGESSKGEAESSKGEAESSKLEGESSKLKAESSKLKAESSKGEGESSKFKVQSSKLKAESSMGEGESSKGEAQRGDEGAAGGRKPKAIVVVHLYGMPAKMDRILEVAAKYDIPVIEDAAEALGSSLNGRKCGGFGRLSVLSFNGNKIITTSGGGALLADDETLIKKARFLATQARDEAPHYQHSELGYNYRMSNIVAGIGRGQMQVIDERVALRRANHDYYFEALGETWLQVERSDIPATVGNAGNKKPDDAGAREELSAFSFELSASSPTGIYFLKEPEGFRSNRWLTTVLVNPDETGGVTRDDIRLALERQNIECRPLWKPMHLQPLYRDFPQYGSGVSDWLFEYGLCLPSGSNLTGEDRERVVEAIRQVIKA